MNNWIVTKKEAAAFFRVSVQALDGWFNRDCPVYERDEHGRIKRVSLQDMHEWRLAQSGEGGKELEIERTRLTKAQADKTELEVEVLKGSLIPAEKVEDVWGSMLGAFRARCLSIPTKAAHAVLAVADLAEAEAILKDHLHEALSELAEYDASQYSAQPGGEDGAHRRASTGDDGEPVGRRAPTTKQRGKRRARPVEH